MKRLLAVWSDFKSFKDRLTDFIDRPNHTPKRIINEILSISSRKFYFQKALNYPVTLMVEPTTACQLKCPLCPVGLGKLERDTQFMEMKTFKKVIDDVGDYIYKINFNGAGEPLLNKKIVQMIRYGKQKKLYIDVYSNLQLTNKPFLKDIVNSGLDRILISLDGTSKDVYETYRINGQFERIIENIKFLVQEKKRSGSKISIDLQFVIMNQNQHQLKDIEKLSKSLGADNLFIKPAFLFLEKSTSDKVKQFIPENKALSMYKNESSSITWEGRKKRGCMELWLSSVILCDGSVSPCCFDYNGNVIFGNIHETRFKQIWNGKKYRSFRKQMLLDSDKIKLCTSMEGGCPSLHFLATEWITRLN
ncbi:MAG: radical SAM protein [Desulfobacteraceae bacterium]|nr:radical SAM protein [Desulfobacteraceae bacterium]